MNPDNVIAENYAHSKITLSGLTTNIKIGEITKFSYNRV